MAVRNAENGVVWVNLSYISIQPDQQSLVKDKAITVHWQTEEENFQ